MLKNGALVGASVGREEPVEEAEEDSVRKLSMKRTANLCKFGDESANC